MRLAKTSALVAGFVGAMALGVWLGPSLTDRARTTDAPAAPVTASAPVEHPQQARPSRAARARAATGTVASAPAVDLSAPELHQRLKPVLNRGADLSIASNGFRNAEQFATVAHAARNTEVPFMLLKHRVLNQGKTLSEAIHESKPELDAAVEAGRARDEARQDLASVAS